MNAIFTEEDIISVFTRADAIAEGVLIDLSANSRRFYKYPVACTAEVWAAITSTGSENPIGEIVRVLYASIHNHTKMLNETTYLFTVNLENAAPREHWTFKVMCHGGDNAEPVLTIMGINED